jgi:L-amino acid N-acyltransferase YncA
MKATIRLASEIDAAAIAEIYAPFCESTAVSFEYKAPSTTEMAERIRALITRLPWLVLDENGTVAGYVYASLHRERAAYGWSVDTTAYVSPGYLRHGVGRALYMTLFQLLRLQGYYKAFAGITLPNPASIGLHQSVGFKPVGIYRGVGYKIGAWHDVSWYQLSLQPERLNPQLPLPLSSIFGSVEWAKAIDQGLAYYRVRQPDLHVE